MIKKLFSKLQSGVVWSERYLYIRRKRKRLKNVNPTILSSNCNGGIILHDMKLKFNTPTINLYFNSKDFLKFISNIDYYLNQNLEEIESDYDYPVGKLKDINIYFMHYSSFSEAKSKWEERKKRIDKTNLFIMMTDKDGCTYEQIVEFDNLPYKNKVIFTHIPYPEISSSFYIKGFEKDEEVGILSEWKPSFWKRRWLDDYDYVSFLNR